MLHVIIKLNFIYIILFNIFILGPQWGFIGLALYIYK